VCFTHQGAALACPKGVPRRSLPLPPHTLCSTEALGRPSSHGFSRHTQGHACTPCHSRTRHSRAGLHAPSASRAPGQHPPAPCPPAPPPPHHPWHLHGEHSDEIRCASVKHFPATSSAGPTWRQGVPPLLGPHMLMRCVAPHPHPPLLCLLWACIHGAPSPPSPSHNPMAACT
jgi:hypothetical protein